MATNNESEERIKDLLKRIECLSFIPLLPPHQDSCWFIAVLEENTCPSKAEEELLINYFQQILGRIRIWIDYYRIDNLVYTDRIAIFCKLEYSAKDSVYQLINAISKLLKEEDPEWLNKLKWEGKNDSNKSNRRTD